MITLFANLWKQPGEQRVITMGTTLSPLILEETLKRFRLPSALIPSSMHNFPHGQKVESSWRYVMSVDGISPSPYLTLIKIQ